jgi:hypothetical protein
MVGRGVCGFADEDAFAEAGSEPTQDLDAAKARCVGVPPACQQPQAVALWLKPCVCEWPRPPSSTHPPRPPIWRPTITMFSLACAHVRCRYTIALLAASRLFRLGAIDADQKSHLKDMILQDHVVVQAAIEAFESDGDREELLDTLQRLSARGH